MAAQHKFDGWDYVPARDNPRLTEQYWRVFRVMEDGIIRTLSQLEGLLPTDKQTSISAQLRHA